MRNIYLVTLFLLANVLSFGQSASFSTDLTNNENCGGTIVTFTIDDTTGINTYNWSFGNGEPDASGSISPTNPGTVSTSYINYGAYSIVLTINSTDSTSQTITIFSFPDPSFVINNGTEEACINGAHNVEFDYSGQIKPYGGIVKSWNYNFNDGTGVHSYNIGDVNYIYTASGIYNVVLEVEDDNGCKTDTVAISAVKLYTTPLADFSYTHPQDCALPIDVDFTDISTDASHSIDTWLWTITDKASGTVVSTSPSQNPQITFSNSGKYDVNLKVTTVNGCTDEITKTISFNANIVDFTPTTVQSVCPGQTIHFTNTSTDGFTGTPISFLWDFGDGSTSTDENPDYQYMSDAGSPFTVSLTVEFSNNCVSVKSVVDLVEVSSAGTLDFTIDKNESCDNFTANFQANAGYLLYEWDFDYDGITPDIDVSSSDSNATNNFDAEGGYSIYLRATNSSGCLDEKVYDSIYVKYPIADFETVSGKAACAVELATFDASTSINVFPSSQSNIIYYHWDFNSDGIIDITTVTPVTSYRYSSEGKFDVQLIIETETGCLDTIVKVEEVERGFPPNVSFTYSQTNKCVNTPIIFVNTSTPFYLASDPIDSVFWSFGDGTIIRDDTSSNVVSHVYEDDTEDDGSPYNVELIVYENGCPSGIDTAIIHIDQPIARFESSTSVDCSAGAGTFTLTAKDGNRLSEGVDYYRWDFGDGTYYPGPTANDWATGSDPSTTHSFNTIGVFDVFLFVQKTGSICEDFYHKEFNVNYNTIDFAASDTIICREEENIVFTNLSTSSSSSVNYSWDFGADANPLTSTQSSLISVNYTTSGLKDVKLVMVDANGCTKTKIKQQYIDVRGPTADFNWVTTNPNGDAQCLNNDDKVVFTSTSNSYPNTNTNVSFKWNFGAGGNPPSANRTNEDPIDVQYINAGKKTISLLVTDDRGCTNKKTRSDLIKVPEPISKFIISANKRCIGDDISFEDKSSDNAFATLNTWMWDFGADASPADFNGKTPPNVDYSGGGIKNINLIIEDDLGCTDTSSQNYEIYVANASFTNDMTPGCSPADVTFINTSISTKTWNWEFGDPLSPSSKKENPTNLYVYPGVYDVQLIATSLGGCVDTVLVPAAVTVDGPYYDSITMVIDQPCLNSPSDPKAIFKVYGLHDVKRVKLDFGDASIAFDTTIADIYNPPAFIKINHTYSIQGEFTVKLTLEDDLNAGAGCGEVVYIPNLPIVSIGMRPTANFSTDAIAGESCVNMNVKFTDTSIDNDPNHNVNKWHYDFGDPLNSDSDIKDPTFKYLQQGTVYITHKATTSLGCFDTITKSLLILPGINDLSIATDDTLCEGATTVLDAATPTGGDGTYVFNWKESYNNVDWNNAISPHIDEDYTTHQTTPTVVETIYYKRKVTSNNCRLWGPVYTVTTFQTTDGGTLTPISSTECFDGNGGSIDLNGRIGSVLKWQSDTIIDFTTLTNIANVSDQLNYANLTDTTWYRAIVKNGVCPSDTSAVSVINIIPEIKGNIINPTDTLLCIQEDAGTIIATPPTGGDGSFTFQWQSSIDNISFSNIAGATAATYSPGGLNETTFFRREVITANNCDEISNVYKAEVIDAPIDDKLVSNPFVCQESPTANTQIIIYNSEPGIKYQLRLDIDDSPIGNPLIGDGNDLVMSTVTPLATTIYNIFASDTLPNGAGFVCGGIELSNKATITIIPIPADNLSSNDPIICPGTYYDITLLNSELNVKYYLRDNLGSDVMYKVGTGNNLVFTLLNTQYYDTWASFTARSTIHGEMCAEVPLVDTVFITVLSPPDTTQNVSDIQLCNGSGSFNITVDSTSSSFYYSLVEVGGSFIETKLGNNSTLIYSLPEPITSISYQIWVKSITTPDFGLCDSLMLPDLAIVELSGAPDTTMAVNGDKICIGNDGIVELENSELNVDYQLYDGVVALGLIKAGTGASVYFNIPSPTITKSYNIKARSQDFASACSAYLLADTALVTIIPNPTDVPVESSPNPAQICSGNPLDIIVKGTELGVTYQLRLNGIDIPGQIFNGDGNDHTFTVFPTGPDTYTVFVEQSTNSRIMCAGFELSSNITVTFDGPIVIHQQPLDEDICDGSAPIFKVVAQNMSPNAITYQWQVSPNNTVFNDINNGAVYNGVQISDLTILDITGLDGHYYRCIIKATNACDSVISDAGMLTVIATPITDSLIISINDICRGEDLIIDYSTDLVLNKYYKIYYNAVGANPLYDANKLVHVTSQTGQITFPADSFQNVGATAINITKVDYAFGHGCASAPFFTSDLFNVEAVPDTIGIILSASDICVGVDEDIIVNSQLQNAVYNVSYDLSGANTTAGATASLSTSLGYGNIVIPNTQLTNVGNTVFTLKDIAFTHGQLCSSSINKDVDFIVEEFPVAITQQPVDANICSGTSALFEVVANNIFGGTIVYQWQESSDNITFVDINNGAIYTGANDAQLSVVDISSKHDYYYRVVLNSANQCTALISDTAKLNAGATPISTNLSISIDNVCLGNDLIVDYTSNLVVNESYRFHYNVIGTNVINDTSEVIYLINQNGSLSLPSSMFPNTGINTMTVTEIDFASGQGCGTVGLSVNDLFEINAIPDTIGLSLSSTDICVGVDEQIIINGQLLNNVYKITYDLTGANVISDANILVSFSSGVGIIDIPSALLTNVGNTIFTIKDIAYTHGEHCAIPYDKSIDFNVEEFPVEITQQPVDANICSGSLASFSVIANNILGGTINYQWQESSDNITFIDIINGAIYTGANDYQLSVLDISTKHDYYYRVIMNSADQCSALISDTVQLNASATPIATNLTISIDDVCLGTDLAVDYTSNLVVNETYRFRYNVIGSNTIDTSEVVLLLNANGQFDLPSVMFPNTGNNTLTITEIDYASGLGCALTGLNVSDIFEIEPLPDTNNLSLVSTDICVGMDESVVVNSQLTDGLYNVIYDLSGANSVSSASLPLSVAAGVGSITIPNAQLTNTGATTFIINEIASTIGQSCGTIGYSASIDFNVNDYSVVITQQPFDAHVCSGTMAIFSVVANNTVGGIITYQWQESSDSLTFNDIVNGATYGGVNDAQLDVLDISSKHDYFYRVVINSANQCNPLISDVVKLNAAALPITSNIGLSVDDLCVGNDVVVNYTSNLEINKDYRFYYNIIGANPKSDTSEVVHLTASNGHITFDSDSFPNTGTNVITLTGVDYVSGQGCSSIGLSVSEIFEIEALPDTANIVLSSSNICVGLNETINLAGQLSNDVYNITYNLSGANNVTASNVAMSFVNGNGAIMIYNSQLLDTGITLFTITDIAYTHGQSCGTQNYRDSIDFRVEPMPDTNAFEIDIPNICTGSDAVVGITSVLGDGDYIISYSISGANISANNLVAVTISSGNGSGDFSISTTLLQDTGITKVNISDISYANGNNCEIDVANVEDEFRVEKTPDLNGLALYAPTICEGDSAIVYFTSNLPDGEYLAYMTLTGSNPTFVDTILLELNQHNGNANFIIDNINIPNAGLTTVSISKVTCATGLQCESLINVSTSLNISPLPDTSALMFAVQNTCVNTSTTVSISGNLTDGSYVIIYDLGGANVISSIPVIVDFNNGDGTANFAIDSTNLISVGNTTLTFVNITDQTPNSCGIDVYSGSTDFEVEELPIINNVDIDVQNICIGNSAIVNINSNLVDGTYNILYDLITVNTNNIYSDSINVIGGVSSFIIDASKITAIGLTNVVLLDVVSTIGQQCSNAITIIDKDSFIVEPLPNDIGAQFFANDACQGDDVVVLGVSNLIDNSYTVYFSMTGANPISSDSVIINLTQSNGTFSFIIDNSFIPNSGANTIHINGIKRNSGQECVIASTYTSNFTVIELPDINNMSLTPMDICLGMDEVINISSDLVDDTYQFIVKINGANGFNTIMVESDFVNGDGSGSIILPYTELLNPGVDSISIIEVSFASGTSCSAFVGGADAIYNIEDVPHTDTLILNVPNVCLTYPAPVEFTGSLLDGVYNVSYDLTGVNAISNQMAPLTVISGIGQMEVPASLLTNVGTNDLIINSISNTTTMSCEIIGYQSISFIVVPDPGSITVAIAADGICLGSDAEVAITSALVDGVYKFTYDLESINMKTDIDVSVTLANGDGSGSFIIPDTLLIIGGVQNIKITSIEVSTSTSCASSGLDIPASFNIEGLMEILTETYSGNVCPANSLEFEVTAQNHGAGNIYYQWMKSIDGYSFDTLYNQDEFTGVKTPKLTVSDNSSINGLWIQCNVYTDHCLNISSDSVQIENLIGSVCGIGLENVPNAISPNGDGTNDTWVIKGIQNYPNNKVTLYNRWGNLVFEMDAYDNTNNYFDGKGNAGMGKEKELSDGTYYYFIDMGNGQDILKAYFVIHR